MIGLYRDTHLTPRMDAIFLRLQLLRLPESYLSQYTLRLIDSMVEMGDSLTTQQ